MPEFTAKDVQALRQATGAGMMDAKKALAGERRRHRGRRPVAAREGPGQGRPSSATARTRQGAVAVVVDGNVGAIVELKCETDFSAKADDFTSLVQDLAELVAGQGHRGRGRARQTSSRTSRSPRRRTSSSGTVVRFEAGRRQPARLLPAPPGRPRRQRRAGRAGRRHARSWPTTSPCTSPSPSRRTCTRDEVPADAVEKERQALLEITKAEGKPEQAWPKIVEGRLNAWFKDQVLLEQGFVRDDKTDRSPSCSATPRIVRFAQVVHRRA